MVSTKTLTLLALSVTAAVALPHRRHSNNVCAGPKTRTVTSIKYVHTTTAAAGAAAPTSAIAPTTAVITTISTTTASQAAGSFYEATPQPSTTLATSVIFSSAVAPVAAAADTPVPSSRSDSVDTGVITTGKKGLAYNDPALLGLFAGSDAAWSYNWGVSPGGNTPEGIEFVPMCWGRNEAPGCADKVLAQNAKHVLSFNEPDQVGQAHMDVGEAVALHKQYIAQPLAGKVLIGSPAVTNGQDEKGMGIRYLTDFTSQCNNECALDFLNVHWYWEASGADDFETRFAAFIERAIALAKTTTTTGQVWVTEFSNKGSTQQNIEFVGRAVAYLDKNPNVGRYAYFMVGQADGMGMVDGASLNSVGQAYAS